MGHSDGKAWIVVCAGLRRYCKAEKGYPDCSNAADFKEDVQAMINDEIVEITDIVAQDAGVKKNDIWKVGNFIPFHDDSSSLGVDSELTDKLTLRSGYCIALKNVVPGSYQLKLKNISTERRFQF